MKQGRAFLESGSSITLRATSAGLIFPSLINVGQEAGKGLFQMNHHLAIIFQVATKGIRDVTTAELVVSGKFGDQINLVFGLWKIVQNGSQMAAAQGKDVRGCLNKIDRHRLAAMGGKVLALFLGQGHAVLAGLLP